MKKRKAPTPHQLLLRNISGAKAARDAAQNQAGPGVQRQRTDPGSFRPDTPNNGSGGYAGGEGKLPDAARPHLLQSNDLNQGLVVKQEGQRQGVEFVDALTFNVGPRDGLRQAPEMSEVSQETIDALGVIDTSEAAPLPPIESVSANLPGSMTPTIFAFWPADADKLGSDFSAAWALIDGKTTSAVTLAYEFRRSANEALTDQNLSEVGRRAAVAGVTRRVAARLASTAVLFPAVRDAALEKDADLAGVDPYTAGKPWVWAHDAETGRMVRSMTPEARRAFVRALTLGEHSEAAESLLRLPPHLSGLSGANLAAVRAAVLEAKNPGFGRWSRLRRMAVTAAASAINRLATILERDGRLPPAELRELLGAGMVEVRAFLAADGQPASPNPLEIASARAEAAEAEAANAAATWRAAMLGAVETTAKSLS